MAHLIVWPISDTTKIIVSSPVADLGTVTCCDLLSVVLQLKEQSITLLSDITGCQLTELQKTLQRIFLQQAVTGRISDQWLIGADSCGQILLEVRQNNQPFFYAVLPRDVLQSWITQLDLLHVVMEENENEKKVRGTGCCG